MNVLMIIEQCLAVIFMVCYSYQLFYVAYMLATKKTLLPDARRNHRIGVVICARNEEEVLPQLLESVKAQDYPAQCIEMLVVADNCTDNTAAVARRMGARVFERNNTAEVGKGYALDFLFKRLIAENNACEGFLVLDADNILTTNYITEMNRTFDAGFRVVTSYRNSKNYASNWISAGYSLWFLRESKYLNNARMRLGTSCAISGTGFLISMDIVKSNGGWVNHLLTEDIEFTSDCMIKGERIGYAQDAMLYDEQPVTFKQSWTQRLRWSKGFYQVLGHKGSSLTRGIFKEHRFACYDMLMTIFPALFLTMLSIICHTTELFSAIALGKGALSVAISGACFTVLKCYGLLYIVGLITTITEWKNIHCSTADKILYSFTFPLFMLTYIPVAVWSLINYRNIGWAPIKHTACDSVQSIIKND